MTPLDRLHYLSFDPDRIAPALYIPEPRIYGYDARFYSCISLRARPVTLDELIPTQAALEIVQRLYKDGQALRVLFSDKLTSGREREGSLADITEFVSGLPKNNYVSIQVTHLKPYSVNTFPDHYCIPWHVWLSAGIPPPNKFGRDGTYGSSHHMSFLLGYHQDYDREIDEIIRYAMSISPIYYGYEAVVTAHTRPWTLYHGYLTDAEMRHIQESPISVLKWDEWPNFSQLKRPRYVPAIQYIMKTQLMSHGLLRGVYRINYLSSMHLDEWDCAGGTLRNWILADPASRGVLEPMSDTLWRWWVAEEIRDGVEEAMFDFGLLVDLEGAKALARKLLAQGKILPEHASMIE